MRVEEEKCRLYEHKFLGIALSAVILLSMFYSLPLVSAVYTVAEHCMPPEPDDSEAICAMKTMVDGYFYVPNVAIDFLKVEWLFDNQHLMGDQAGVNSPYDAIDYWPDGKVGCVDLSLLGSAWYTSEGDAGWEYMADINGDGIIGTSDLSILGASWLQTGLYITDLNQVTVTFSTGKVLSPDSVGFVTIPQGATSFTVKKNGNPVGALVTFWGPYEPPIAYSTAFYFTVPAYTGGDAGKEVWYYVLARLYVPSGLSGQNFYFVATADYSVQNVKVNGYLKAGSGSPVNIDLGILSGGYNLLEFEFIDVSGGGSLSFHVATVASQCAWLSRFRTYVPNYSDAKVEYTVKTYAYFPGDTFFLGSSANEHVYIDDYISDVYVDAGLLWHDWMWNIGDYGAIYAWRDGFLYPLGWQTGWHTIKFTYGEIWADGTLDFQYISQSNQQAKIGNPRFWARISEPKSPYPPGNIRHLEIYDVNAWTGSKWASTIGGSVRTFAVGLKILANATDTNTFYPIPQEAEVTLVLDMLGYELPYLSPQDIGLHINVTYTYFNENSFVYSFPIRFEVNSIEIKTPTQGGMLYVPYPSIVSTTQSSTSFITPEWKAAYEALKWLTSFLLVGTLGPAGAIGAVYQQWRMSEYMYRAGQQLNSTWEESGIPTYRKYHMNPFKTTKDQVPLSDPVRSVSNGFFFRMMPTASKYCGAINITLQGRLWLPFFYSGEPPPDSPNWYGEWLPIDIGISIVTPVFIKEM